MRPDRRTVTLTALLTTLLLTACATPGGGGSGAAGDPDQSGTTVTRPDPEPMTEKQMSLEEQAKAAVDEGAFETTFGHLASLHEMRPDLGHVIARMGWIRQQQERLEAAMTLYRDALAVDPGQRLALNNLALLERERGRFREARRWLEQGLQWHPDSARLHYNLAVLLELHLLELQQALGHYKRYQALRSGEDTTVAGWIADLERRVE